MTVYAIGAGCVGSGGLKTDGVVQLFSVITFRGAGSQVPLYALVNPNPRPLLQGGVGLYCNAGAINLSQNIFYAKGNGAFLGPLWKFYPTLKNTYQQYHRYATLYDPRAGSEIVLPVLFQENVPINPLNATWGFTPGVSQYDERVVLPLEKAIDYFVGEPGKYLSPTKNNPRQAVFCGPKTTPRTITISRSEPLPPATGDAQYQTVAPNSTPFLQINPVVVAQIHKVSKGGLYPSSSRKSYLTHFGTDPHVSNVVQTFIPQSDAWRFYYEVYYLFDPDIVPPSHAANTYVGSPYFRLGIPEFQAEALIQVETKHKWFLFSTTGFMRGFLRNPIDVQNAIEKIRRGVTASMAVRDSVAIDTMVYRKLQLRDLLKADGTFKVGQYVQN